MSDIGLLMTGILTTGQASGSNLPEKLSVEPDNQVQQFTLSEITSLVAAAKITPPEFIPHTTINPLTNALTLENKNILNTISQKIRSKNFSSLRPCQTSHLECQDNNKILVAQSQDVGTQTLPTIGFGNSGVSVKVLQRLLRSNGYTVKVDGFFGALTETAVKAFQNKRNLITDGVVGVRTWYELTR
ncbi:MAG: peptidoglycan-binding protein [Cyanomargarita calcarea GSE-NOS-MK-12-04C]|uniref:Peptidoglycan-binding protein n=1 Tax=Cyanomargarita calcarea GSE-NOS-MK-12-04C TaxID=2839659 RepID=A0A951QUG8_9CYAN|nr:peptidoglycan-binding protein [Cyanomargarita calcarea GSE-NOS-MK-12-04C]